MRWSQ